MGDYKDLDIFEILLRIVGFGGLKDYPVCMLYEVFKANSSYQNIKLGPKGRVFFFNLCVLCVFCLHVCMYTTCLLGAREGQKRASDPLELELK